jgi:hypothetical protein
MTWVVSSENLSDQELIDAVKHKLRIVKNSDLSDQIIIKSVREVQGWHEDSRNVAYVKFIYKFPENVIHKGFIMAIEGKQFIPGTAIVETKDGKKEIIIDPLSPVSKVYKVVKVAEDKEWYHALRKLIVTMADLWELENLLDGEVLIVSEGPICRSCKAILHKFEEEYPNIKKISIRENVGV